MSARTPQEAQQHASVLLYEHGIDASMVMLNGLDKEGYSTFVFKTDGERAFEWHGDDPLYSSDRHTWPEGFPVEDFLKAANEWKASL